MRIYDSYIRSSLHYVNTSLSVSNLIMCTNYKKLIGVASLEWP